MKRASSKQKDRRALRNSLLYLAAYEIIMLVFAIFIWQANPFGTAGNGSYDRTDRDHRHPRPDAARAGLPAAARSPIGE